MALRERVDAVLAGTGTLREEELRADDPGPRAPRERESRPVSRAEPLAVRITPQRRVPLDIPLFAEPEARVVVFAGARARPGAASRGARSRCEPRSRR